MEGREGQKKEGVLTLELLSALISSELVPEDDLTSSERREISSEKTFKTREGTKEGGPGEKGKQSSPLKDAGP